MKTHNVQQGSAEWHALRRDRFTASEAAAMMGVSPYCTRTELLEQKTTGLVPEANPHAQSRFDDGHAAEAAFRPIAERIVGVDFYPVTGSIEIDGMKLLASFDGLSADDSIVFEHKLYSEKLARMCGERGEVTDPAYYWQLEHQLLVSGAERVEFFASDGAAEKMAHALYFSYPERREALIAGWRQFAEDLANYVPEIKAEPAPAGRAPETLPALRIELSGVVTASNLQVYKDTAIAVFGAINRELTTDQHFSDAEKTVKWCADIEDRIKAAKAHALSQTESIDLLFRTMDEVSGQARAVRLELDKLVKGKKEALRAEIVSAGHQALRDHVAALNDRLGKPYMPAQGADFAGAISGKRSIDSIRDAVSVALANAKIAASSTADRIEMNLKSLRELAKDYAFLFADTAQIVMKDNADMVLLINARIADHKAAEEKRLEAERARIRAEEAKKLADAQTAQEAARIVAEAPMPTISPSLVAKPIATSPASPELVLSAIAHEFLGSRNWLTEATKNTARAVLIEFEKFCANQRETV